VAVVREIDAEILSPGKRACRRRNQARGAGCRLSGRLAPRRNAAAAIVRPTATQDESFVWNI